MDFAQWTTLAAIAAGPLGIAAGWFLSEHSEEKRAARAERNAEHQAIESRVLTVIQEARRAAGEFRSIAGGTYLGIKGPQQQAAMDLFNESWRNLEVTLAACGVLGPAWLKEPGEHVLGVGREGMETAMDMQKKLTNENIKLVQEQITQLDEAVDSLIEAARENLPRPATA